MRYREFGDSGVQTSSVGFGAWALGSDWWGETDDPDTLVETALDLGITYFESGDVYGQGENERILGRALTRAGAGRDEVQIATKFGYLLDSERDGHADSERPQDFSPDHIRSALEQSLARLGTDYVDLYQLHNPRIDAIESGPLFELLEQFKAEGKIRAYGVALGPAIGWRHEGSYALERRRISALQTVYNLLERDPGDHFIEAAENKGNCSVIARVPTASGLLEDRYTPDMTFSGSDHRRFRPKQWLSEGLTQVERYRFLTRDGERTMAQAALLFILAREAVSCVLPTVTRVSELEEWAAAGAGDVPEMNGDELSIIDELYQGGFARLIGGELRG